MTAADVKRWEDPDRGRGFVSAMIRAALAEAIGRLDAEAGPEEQAA